MKKILVLLCITSSLTMLQGCDLFPSNEIGISKKPVIEAFLAPNSPVKIKVSTIKPFNSSSDSLLPINGLIIKIIGNDGRTFTLKNQKDGLYFSSNNELIGNTGSSYKMSFNYQNKIISASTVIPEKPSKFKSNKQEVTIKPTQVVESNGVIGITSSTGSSNNTNATNKITLSWENPKSDYHFISYFNTTQNPESVVSLPPGILIPEIPSFTLPPDRSSISFLHADNFKTFGRYAIILYKLNKDYAALFETSDSSTQNIRTPNSIITNGLGIFTGINTDTIYVDVKKQN